MRSFVCLFFTMVLCAATYAQTEEKKYDPYKDPRNFSTTSVVSGDWVEPVTEKDGCRMKDGVLRCYRNNVAMAIDRHMELDNHIIAFMNGVVFTLKGEIIRLKNGDAIDLNAVKIEPITSK